MSNRRVEITESAGYAVFGGERIYRVTGKKVETAKARMELRGELSAYDYIVTVGTEMGAEVPRTSCSGEVHYPGLGWISGKGPS